MKIKLSVSIAGQGFALEPGDVTDRFPEADAARLVSRGYAEPVVEVAIETTSLAPPPERRGKRKR